MGNNKHTKRSSTSLTTGKKIFVKESRQKIENLVKSYKRDIFSQIMKINE